MGQPLQALTLPNIQITLHPEYLDLLSRQWASTTDIERLCETMHVGDFQRLLTQLNWMRLVKFEETDEHQILVLAGLYRLVKEKDSPVVWGERAKLMREDGVFTWCWVRTSIMPTFRLMDNSSTDFMVTLFKRLFENVLVEIINDLCLLGVQRISIPLKKMTDAVEGTWLSLSGAKQACYGLDLTQPWCCDELRGRVLRRFKGIDEAGLRGGCRALYKYLWLFVDKRCLSIYLKIQQVNPTYIQFDKLMVFQSQGIDLDHFEANALWLPWLKKLDAKHFKAPNLFTYDYLLPLVGMGMTKKKVRRINQFPRTVQVALLQGGDAQLQIASIVRAYPTSVISRIIDLSCYAGAGESYLRIYSKWSAYFANMIGEVKPRKQSAQWTRALDQLSDVLHWHEQGGVVHKNQNWYALMQQHDRWLERLNEEKQVEEAELDAKSWVPAIWNGSSLACSEIDVEEITTGKRLRAEGQEMEHCVWSYLNDCLKQCYRVFSFRTSKERVTLGLYMDPVTLKCSYDQLRGPKNDIASQSMQQLARRLIKQINREVVSSQ